MPLSFEQFKELKQRGLSTEQIVNLEKSNGKSALPQQDLSIEQAIKNVPRSAGEFVSGIASAVIHPVKTFMGLSTLAGGAVEKFTPQIQPAEQQFDAVINFFKNRYGSPEQIVRTAVEDPVGFAADISVGLGAISKVARLPKIATTAKTLDPIQASVNLSLKALPRQSLENLASRFYQSALKPSPTLLQKYPEIIKTGLKEQIIVGRDGLEQVRDIIFDIDNQVMDKIVSSSRQKLKIQTEDVITRVDDAAKFYAQTALPTKFLKKLKELKKEFIAVNGKEISLERAQLLKKNTGVLLRKMYGELKDVEIEGQKALVRGLKEEIVKLVPEVGKLNIRERSLINLEKALERFMLRQGNRQLTALGDIGAAGVGGIAFGQKGLIFGLLRGIFENPELKSRVANILFKTSQRQIRPPVFLKTITPITQVSQEIKSKEEE